ncbi:MAG TPA: hypothetical protein PLH39_08230, partial [Promineifilum sp.]|nr:hypothetical protein [Promineifilum sp.]
MARPLVIRAVFAQLPVEVDVAVAGVDQAEEAGGAVVLRGPKYEIAGRDGQLSAKIIQFPEREVIGEPVEKFLV